MIHPAVRYSSKTNLRTDSSLRFAKGGFLRNGVFAEVADLVAAVEFSLAF